MDEKTLVAGVDNGKAIIGIRGEGVERVSTDYIEGIAGMLRGLAMTLVERGVEEQTPTAYAASSV